jgi:hypothetical protein
MIVLMDKHSLVIAFFICDFRDQAIFKSSRSSHHSWWPSRSHALRTSTLESFGKRRRPFSNLFAKDANLAPSRDGNRTQSIGSLRLTPQPELRLLQSQRLPPGPPPQPGHRRGRRHRRSRKTATPTRTVTKTATPLFPKPPLELQRRLRPAPPLRVTRRREPRLPLSRRPPPERAHPHGLPLQPGPRPAPQREPLLQPELQQGPQHRPQPRRQAHKWRNSASDSPTPISRS